MTILEEIIENKSYEVERAKTAMPISILEQMPFFKRKTNSLVKALKAKNSTGIIAEFKRKSPSKGNINIGAGISETTTGYAKAGAAGLSVLTDTVYFGGFKEDVQIARENNPETPILRKDFTIDEYQLYEAKAWGADAILLIASALSADEIKALSHKANELGLEVLLEIHDKEELDKSPLEFVDIIGVNNRNLKNFEENNINASLELSELIPANKVKISESCISSPEIVIELKEAGYQGFLIGESFMKSVNPPKALSDFLEQL